MTIKLAYKEYGYKVSLEAKSEFTKRTGLDLLTVFQKVWLAQMKLFRDGATKLELHVGLSEIYQSDIICDAFHCIIKAADSSIPREEIVDAVFRTSWFQEEAIDGMSEEWCLVMANTAFQINDYLTGSLLVKKPGILAESLLM